MGDDSATLVRVVALERQVPLASGGDLTLSSLEVWSDGIVLHTIEQPGPDDSRRSHRIPWWTVTDDLGTDYQPSLFSGNHWLGGRVRRIYAIVPAPPAAATRISLSREDLMPGQELYIPCGSEGDAPTVPGVDTPSGRPVMRARDEQPMTCPLDRGVDLMADLPGRWRCPACGRGWQRDADGRLVGDG